MPRTRSKKQYKKHSKKQSKPRTKKQYKKHSKKQSKPRARKQSKPRTKKQSKSLSIKQSNSHVKHKLKKLVKSWYDLKKVMYKYKNQKGGSIASVDSALKKYNDVKSKYDTNFKSYEDVAKALYNDFAIYADKMKLARENLKDILKKNELDVLGTPKLNDITKLDKYSKFTTAQTQLTDLIEQYITAEKEYLKQKISDNEYLQKQYMGNATSALGKAQAFLMPNTFKTKQEKIQSDFNDATSTTATSTTATSKTATSTTSS